MKNETKKSGAKKAKAVKTVVETPVAVVTTEETKQLGRKVNPNSERQKRLADKAAKIAISEMSFTFNEDNSFSADLYFSRTGSNGNITKWSIKLPLASKHTTLQPERNPGSMANIFLDPNGASNKI